MTEDSIKDTGHILSCPRCDSDIYAGTATIRGDLVSALIGAGFSNQYLYFVSG